MKELKHKLFEFAKSADHLRQELRTVPVTSPDIEAVFHVQAQLAVLARDAESLASALGMEGECPTS